MRIMSRLIARVSVLGVLLGSTGSAQVSQRVNVDSSGTQANNYSYFTSISADGRYVGFHSYASNLVPGDTNAAEDVFIRDRASGTTTRVSVDSSGIQGNGISSSPSLSADGRYVAFWSYASNLVVGDTNAVQDVFVRDRQSATTVRASVNSSAAQASGSSFDPSISGDGRYVAFVSAATNLVSGDTNGFTDIFVRDLSSGTTVRASVDSSGLQANGDSYEPSVSGDGRYVAFVSTATNLVSGDTNGNTDIFVRDLSSGITVRASVDSTGAQALGGPCLYPSFSANGRYVVFKSDATNLVPGDTNGYSDIFVRDLLGGTTLRASVDSSGAQALGGVSDTASISADGRYVAFGSNATNLVSSDTNTAEDVFLRDLSIGTTARVSVSSSGAQSNQGSSAPSVSADGRFVAFASDASTLVAGDTNGLGDIFVHDDNAAGFTGICAPGVGGVIACPCSNAPGGPNRGCDNSSTTGGAILSASGLAYISMDSLVFSTSAEKPTATSIVMQGNSLAASGLVFGQGVRCVGGALKRLYTRTASGGSISAPNIGAGDPTVSARSAALGDLIQAGQSRWYLVYYRDPVVLGGCPASSTFNATQTGQIVWSL